MTWQSCKIKDEFRISAWTWDEVYFFFLLKRSIILVLCDDAHCNFFLQLYSEVSRFPFSENYSPGHLICRLISHNSSPSRSSMWNAKFTVDNIHVNFKWPSPVFINTTKHMSVLGTWLALEICSLNYLITWQNPHSPSDNKY